MAEKTQHKTGRVLIDPKGASTPNLKAIREAAKDFAKAQSKQTSRGELLKRLALSH